MAEKKLYAWSELRLGGESEWIETPTGGRRKVVTSRDTVAPGESVTKADLVKRGISEDEFDVWVEQGVIRDYAMPEMPDGSTQSPTNFVLDSLRLGDTDELDPQAVMALALGNQHRVPAELDSTGEDVKEVAPKK